MIQPYSLIRFFTVFILLFLTFGGESTAQNKVPVEWIRHNLLWDDTIWKYHPGPAQPEFFNKNYDDQHWLTVNENFRDTFSAVESLWPGIGVLRKRFFVPDSLRNKQAEFMMLIQAGASEVYLDGRLLARFGIVGATPNEEKAFLISYSSSTRKPVQLELDSQSHHVLAIHYSNHNPKAFTDRLGGFRGFAVMLTPFTTEYLDNAKIFNHPVISLCIILSFCLFFCFVYAFYPSRRSSLFSILYLANFSLIFITYLVSGVTHDIDRFVLGDSIWRTGFCCNPGWNLLFLYSIYYKRMPKRSWIVVVLMIMSLSLGLYYPVLQLKPILIILIILQLEAWRILILGLRYKRTGFWILTIGSFVSLAGSFIAIFDYFNFFPWYITTPQTVLAIITDLSFPLTLALQLAWEFGSANRDLRKKLTQVNELSAKSLEQELEKQQILSSQNETLERQVHERTTDLEYSLAELKSTQAQLIQSEKMASLGQLTAGVAHEIQNPLNFVNNFSEINNELIEELKSQKSNLKTEEQDELLNDIFQNNEKISQHGKRADSIIKGMLQHSRGGSGLKEPTDINILADEYLRLAYHGMRGKDKSFNATLETHFDDRIGKINIISQDMGRVLLNLYNNAFYAVSVVALAKADRMDGNYMPTVSVKTMRSGDKVVISVKDNGNGVPQQIIDKIFQPFFTTKPTGQGTGLGLSLSYDIVKAHGGTISVKSEVNKGSEFTITL